MIRRLFLVLGAVAFGPMCGLAFAGTVRGSVLLLGMNLGEGSGLFALASSAVACLAGWVLASFMVVAGWRDDG